MTNKGQDVFEKVKHTTNAFEYKHASILAPSGD